MRRRLLLALLAFAAASCGDSSSSDRASKPPREILEEAAAALDHVTSYHVEGSGVTDDGRMRISGDFASSGSMRIEMTTGKQRVSVIVTSADTFIKATRAYWLAQSGTNARKVAPRFVGRWVKLPPAIAARFTDETEGLLPQGLAYCLRQDPDGNLRTKGTRRYSGRQVVVVASDGDSPGESPGELWIAATGPALPLREVQTGPRTPGKRRVSDPLCDSEGSTKKSDIRITRYNEPLRITPPSTALDLAKLAGAVA